MRYLALALALLLTASVARADEDEVATVRVPAHLLDAALAPGQMPALKAQVQRQGDEARAMRNGGIGTVVAGTVLTAIGVGLFMSNLCIDNCSHGNDGALDLGIAALALGQAGVLVGIPIWAVGGARASHSDQVKISLSSTSLQMQF